MDTSVMRTFRHVSAGVAIGCMLVLGPAFAQQSAGDLSALKSTAQNVAPDAARYSLTPGGHLRALSAGPTGVFAVRNANAADPVGTAGNFLSQYAPLLGTDNPDVSFTSVRVRNSGNDTFVRYQQIYQGVPVFGAEAIVQLDAQGGVRSVLSDVMRDFSGMVAVPMTPTISEAAAAGWALNDRAIRKLEELADGLLPEGTPKLVVYAPEVVGSDGLATLAWKLVLANNRGDVKQQVFVDAHSGAVVLSYSLIHEAKNRQVHDANGTAALPGPLARSEGNPVTGIADVDDVYDFLGDTYDFYSTEHGRDGIDGLGATLIATVRYCPDPLFCPFPNAFWDGVQMVFGDGFGKDDITGHELTHGVTENESNLIYAFESGAINESFSDIWGEFIDLSNAAGDDSPGVRWLMGEDIGAIRDMQDPPAFGDPDRYFSPNACNCPIEFDNGGVHIDSGILNKLAYLLTDGDTFNGRTISSLGVSQVADLMYEAQVNLLTQSSDYADLYAQLNQAAINLGWSLGDRDNLEQAMRAVEIGGLPNPPTNVNAAVAEGDPNVTVTWTNPGGSIGAVLVRRTDRHPTSVTDGTVLFSGAGSMFVDGALPIGTQAYYSVFADHGLDTFGVQYYSPPAQAPRVTVGVVPPDDPFTEVWDSDIFETFDMEFTRISFLPAPNADKYIVCTQPATSLNTGILAGTSLIPSLVAGNADDGAALVTLPPGKTVSLYGTEYTQFWAGTNGYVTFESPDTNPTVSSDAHFDQRRISVLFDDLDPSFSGLFYYTEETDRVAISWVNVPEWGEPDIVTMQLELYFNGAIAITYLNVDAEFIFLEFFFEKGIAGLSFGDGTPPGFTEHDLSAATAGCSTDSDSDGISDFDEGFEDADGDMIPNNLDTDSDGDGIDDIIEGNVDSDGDGTADFLDLDSDNDGLDDQTEAAATADPDGDTIPNWLDLDSDGDGFSDTFENLFGTDPYSAAAFPAVPLGAAPMGAALALLGVWGATRVRRRRQER